MRLFISPYYYDFFINILQRWVKLTLLYFLCLVDHTYEFIFHIIFSSEYQWFVIIVFYSYLILSSPLIEHIGFCDLNMPSKVYAFCLSSISVFDILIGTETYLAYCISKQVFLRLVTKKLFCILSTNHPYICIYITYLSVYLSSIYLLLSINNLPIYLTTNHQSPMHLFVIFHSSLPNLSIIYISMVYQSSIYLPSNHVSTYL